MADTITPVVDDTTTDDNTNDTTPDTGTDTTPDTGTDTPDTGTNTPGNYLWFNAQWFAAQKVAQINALNGTSEAPANDVAYVVGEINTWNEGKPEAEQIKPWDGFGNDEQDRALLFTNWYACNDFRADPNGTTPESYYPVVEGENAVAYQQVNVSPNALFDIAYYATAVQAWGASNSYAGTIGTEGLTAAQTLQQMWEKGHKTAWQHFQGADVLGAYLNDENGTHTDPRLDCSADFSTEKYIQYKVDNTAGMTWNDAVQDMIDSGRNPLEDCYYHFGRVAEEQPQLFRVDYDLTIDLDDGAWWIPSTTPAGDDPFNIPGVSRELAGFGVYKGDDGVDTIFDGVYTDAKKTLSPEATIVGGTNASNTLRVELGDDWDGFNGRGTSTSSYNVSGVQRVQIIRANDDSASDELTFNAKGISEEVTQFDVKGAGTGTTNLAGLNDAVTTVNYSNFQALFAGQGAAADLAWADETAPESLTIGAYKLMSSPDEYLAVTGIDGVKNLTVNALGGENNNLDVTAATDAEVINVIGSAPVDVRVEGTSNTLPTLNAKQAAGDVNFHIVNGDNVGQTITGGSGDNDTVTIENSTAATTTVLMKNWNEIENLALNGSQTINVNAQGAQDLTDVWFNGGGNYTVTSASGKLTAHHGAVGDVVSTAAGGINGADLTDITWTTAETGAKANFTSNASKTATISVTDEGTVKDGSTFTFGNATKVYVNGLGDTDFNTGITLNAKNATLLDVQNTSDLVIAGGDLSSLQQLTATLTESTADDGGAFNIGKDLTALTQGQIQAQGQDVTLGALGTAGGGDNLILNVSGADAVTVGTMDVLNNIKASITGATGDVTFGDITTGTAGNAGSVQLTVATEKGVLQTAGATISSGTINVDMTGVQGNVGDSTAGYALTLDASSTTQGIIYKGANGDGFAGTGSDVVQIDGVGAGTTSTITLGGGDDELTIGDGTNAALGNGATVNVVMGAGDDTLTIAGKVLSGTDAATLKVTCGDGKDQFDITAQDNNTHLVVEVKGFTQGEDSLDSTNLALSGWSTTMSTNAGFINGFGAFGLDGTGGALVCVDQASGTAPGSRFGYYEGGDLYLMGTDTGNTTLVVITGVPESVVTDGFDLNGSNGTGA